MIYFDNSATGGKKPDSVYQSVFNAIKYLSVNAGRSAHRQAIVAEEYLYKTRKLLAEFFGADKYERVIFTKNCTEALNLAIFGLVQRGSNVVTTCFEHNSVLRPLLHLKNKGEISLTVVKPKGDVILESDIAKALTPNTKLVCVTGASNVTGEINDYEAIGALLQKKQITFLLDGAQVAGHAEINMRRHGIDVLCVSGHKGLDAIQGAGALIFNRKTNIMPTQFGGSGTESFSAEPSGYPEKLECGTINLPAVISLLEGVLYNKQNFKNKQVLLLKLTAKLILGLKSIDGVKIYSHKNPIGIVSFSYKDYSSQEVAGVLSERFDIAVRGGYHCAPLMHEFLKTSANGLVRASLSEWNTEQEIEYFLYALKKVPEYL